jgi:hypothetical protein
MRGCPRLIELLVANLLRRLLISQLYYVLLYCAMHLLAADATNEWYWYNACSLCAGFLTFY